MARERLSEALRRWVRYARQGGFVESLIFDPKRYLSVHADLAEKNWGRADALAHYVRSGRWEGRQFSPRWSVPDRALRLAREAEERVLELVLLARPWEIAHRLRCDESPQRAFGSYSPLAPDPQPGPWTTPIPEWASPTGWGLVTMQADVPQEGCVFSIVACGAGAPAPSATPLLDCQPGQAAICVVRFNRGDDQLVVRAMGRGRIRGLQVKPISWPVARDRMLERLEGVSGAASQRGLALLHHRVTSEELPFDDALWQTYCESYNPASARPTYTDWMRRVERLRHISQEERVQRRAGSLEVHKFSIVVPVHDPDPELLRRCLESVAAQRYRNWELCIADDGSKDPRVIQTLRDFAARFDRIRMTRLPVSRHICHATNAALEMVTGDYVAFLDHDDALSAYALSEIAFVLEQQPEARVLYSDEDKLDSRGKRYQPHFKPDFDPDRLLGHNYFGHLLVLQTELLRSLGGMRPGYEGAQDHDLVLRATEAVHSSEIVHLPWVLYHWREGAGSTASDPRAKPYADEAGLSAVQEALKRRNEAAAATSGPAPHCYRVRWHLPDPAPHVTMILPTRDGLDVLRVSVESILSRTDYPSYELIIVDNGSVEPDTLAYLRNLQSRGVRVLRDERPFNFSALNNLAVKHARGDLIALVNNDIEVVHPDWLTEMASHAIRRDVGAVGALLLYPDGRIQHGGVVLGLGGVAGHAFKHFPKNFPGYFSALRFARTVGAVTAACLVVQRTKYAEVGGLEEDGLTVAFNDVDFCLKLARAGYRNVLVPHAVLLHHESATRGVDEAPERVRRFQAEQQFIKERWGRTLAEDRYYSPHLTLAYEDYSLRTE